MTLVAGFFFLGAEGSSGFGSSSSALRFLPVVEGIRSRLNRYIQKATVLDSPSAFPLAPFFPPPRILAQLSGCQDLKGSGVRTEEPSHPRVLP